MDKLIWQTLCKIAIDAATQAGAIIQHNFQRNIATQSKDSGSSPASQIVTQVDFMSQELILQLIHPTCEKYNIGLLAEESEDDLSRFRKDYFWCIDPLDGTLPFTEKRPGYSVSIAIVSRQGCPCLGVIYDPYTSTLYHAIKDSGAFRNRKPWHWTPQFDGEYQVISDGGAVMNACCVLENAPACFVKNPKPQQGGGSLWDYAATACLFTEIGAVVCDRYGKTLELNSRDSLFMNEKGILYASHQQIAQQYIISENTE